jgi:drug/metabolite transporter (DMT)-like permease
VAPQAELQNFLYFTVHLLYCEVQNGYVKEVSALSTRRTSAGRPTAEWVIARRGEVGVAAAAVAFGVGSALTVLALRGLTPADMLVVELGGAALVFMLAAGVTGQLHTRGAVRAMAQGVMLPGLTWLLENLGLARTTATSGSLLLGTETLMTVALAVLVLRERVGVPGAIALIFGLAGTSLVSLTPGEPNDLVGDQTSGNLLVIAAVACSAVYVIWSRRTARSSSAAIGLTAWQFAGSALAVSPFVALSWATQRSHFTTAGPVHLLAAIAVLASTIAAMIAFNRSISSVSASRAGLMLSLQPVAGAITAVAVLGEPPQALTAIGGALIVLGVVVLAGADPNGDVPATTPHEDAHHQARTPQSIVD